MRSSSEEVFQSSLGHPIKGVPVFFLFFFLLESACRALLAFVITQFRRNIQISPQS